MGVPQVGGEPRETSLDVAAVAVPVQESGNGKGVSQVVIVPTSAQP